jgi:hypothetical protein
MHRNTNSVGKEINTELAFGIFVRIQVETEKNFRENNVPSFQYGLDKLARGSIIIPT